MSKKIILYEQDELCFQKKFYTLMDILITNQSDSRFESFILMSILYLQIISSFFSENLGVFNPKHAKSDNILNYIEKIVRVKDLFKNNYNIFQILQKIIFIIVLIIIIHFFISIILITKSSFYSYNKKVLNYYIKIFLFVGNNIIYDICFSSFCISSFEYNTNFELIKCSSLNTFIILVSIINIVIAIFFYIFFNIYYNDTFYLSNSYFAKMSCNYDIFMGINCLIISLLLTHITTFSKELFLLYNLATSIGLFIYYINTYLYYNKYINIFTGIFHLLYMWTSIFSLIFAYIDFKEKGIIYIFTSFILSLFYFNIKNRIEDSIFLNIPFYKIANKFYLLHYFRNLYDLINNVEENNNNKSLLSGIIKMHKMECPEPNCLLKTKEDIYLPLTNKWNDKNKKETEDEVFLKNFLVIVMNYFIYINDCSADMYLNLSLYYLKIIGNYCQAIYYYKKITELKLTLREEFSFIRLNIQISRVLKEKLKPSTEQCTELENLDISIYYKYEELSQKFLDEINNDVNLSLQFWKAFKLPYKEPNKKIDFNKIFELTDKIAETKINVKNMWNKLLKIYGGVNNFYELYLEYIEQINDDDLKKRDLESLRRKNDNFSEHLNNNFYAVLFNKETGIIIANGDLGSEGVIESSNKEIENIFKYKPLDLKGMNLTCLMPKIFAKDHSKYMERYFKIGQKKLVDKSDFKSFGKDKENSIVKIKLALKLFPILNDNVFFIGLIQKENLDDIIVLDDKFNIQGMSMKLMKILNINNKHLFQDNEIPFYVICRKFVNFYSIFLHGKKRGETSEKLNTTNDEEVTKDKDKDEEIKKDEKKEKKENEKEDFHENIEINENVELEYEIKLPQFLIDYSQKLNKKEGNLSGQLMTIRDNTEEEITEVNEEFDENEFLLEEKNSDNNLNGLKLNTISKNNLNFSTVTPTPTPGDTMTPGITPVSESLEEDSEINNAEQNVVFNKESEEEKIYKSRMAQYKSLFEEGKVNELEELIDNCNKNSSSTEYKFNFTFDKYKYGNKQLSYIVRCIDNKNETGQSQEESLGDLDPKAAKYKMEKAESIKPLYELLEEERRELLQLPEIFLNLSLENKKFQKLLQSCKNDINIMSKTHGNKKEEILEDENSSQSSQAGFDSGLVRKNRIGEIRSNLMTNLSNFYTLKYIKLIIYLIGILSISFSVLYLIYFGSLYHKLGASSSINLNLYQSGLWTTELMSFFVTIRVLYLREIINKYDRPQFNFFIFDEEYKNISLYYGLYIKNSLKLYDKLSKSLSYLEMEMPNFLNEEQLDKLYWDKINISYMNDNYKNYSNDNDEEYFPLAMAQFLSNSLTFLKSPIFNSVIDNSSYFNNTEDNKVSFDYMTYLIIENGYNNIIPNFINKLIAIPNILSKFNISQINILNYIILFFAIAICNLCILYFFLFYFTNKSMIDGMDKVSRIKLEKIDEIIKRIKLFNINLKKIREKDLKPEDTKENSELFDDDSQIKSTNKSSTYNDKNKKKVIQETSSINNIGFNTDEKRYIPLNVLKYSLTYPIYILIYASACLSLIYIFSQKMIKNTNHLLIVQNYILSILIISSTSTVEIKCNISDCQGIKEVNPSGLFNYDIIQDIIRGLNLFPKVTEFYNEKFLLNACAAAFNEKDSEDIYNQCLNDFSIKTANNTENLLKLIDDLIIEIKKEYLINYEKNNSYYKRDLFGGSNFGQIERIFVKYFLPVEGNFAKCVTEDLNSFLNESKIIVLIILIIFAVVSFIFCICMRIILINKLIHHLSVSRCIMKIIPTSVIISTPELENYIENKY